MVERFGIDVDANVWWRHRELLNTNSDVDHIPLTALSHAHANEIAVVSKVIAYHGAEAAGRVHGVVNILHTSMSERRPIATRMILERLKGDVAFNTKTIPAAPPAINGLLSKYGAAHNGVAQKQGGV